MGLRLVVRSGDITTMSAGNCHQLIKQVENFCLLYSVLNGLPDTLSRSKFLMCEDLPEVEIKKEHLMPCLRYLHSHKHFNGKEFEAAFTRGLNGVHLIYWLRHLESIGVVKRWVFNKLGDNNGQRREILKKIINGEQQNRGQAFILTGFSTTNKDMLQTLKNRIKKKPLEGDAEVHILNLVLKDNVTRKSGKHQSCHAVCLKVDDEGNCWLCDPGKTKVKQISFERKMFEDFLHSLFDIYLLHKIEIDFV